MNKQLKTEPHHLQTDRKRNLSIGVAAGLFLSVTPFLFYSYRLFSTETTSISFLGLTIEAGTHGNINYYFYYLFTKMVFAACFAVWYLTSSHWWKFAILVPFCMLIFQICGIVNTSINYIDEFDFWYSLPVVIPVATILIFMGQKFKFYAEALDLKDEIQEEINKRKS